jgi:hypothetical protein
VAQAFDVVANTLTHLLLGVNGFYLDLRVGFALGRAVCKLRRLKDLALNLSDDARAYRAMAIGLTTGGEGRPLPLLWRVKVVPDMRANADLLASLLLPGVRVFVSSYGENGNRAALVTACALRRAGYKHFWAVKCSLARDDIAAVAGCRLGDVSSHDGFWVT